MTILHGVDRRGYIRVAPEDKHPIRVDINGIDFIDILHALDISEGGISICVPRGFDDYDIGNSISFVITLPQPKRVLLRGKGSIQHISEDCYGINFENTTYEVNSHIREYVALHVKEESWLRWLKYKMRLVA